MGDRVRVVSEGGMGVTMIKTHSLVYKILKEEIKNVTLRRAPFYIRTLLSDLNNHSKRLHWEEKATPPCADTVQGAGVLD